MLVRPIAHLRRNLELFKGPESAIVSFLDAHDYRVPDRRSSVPDRPT